MNTENKSSSSSNKLSEKDFADYEFILGELNKLNSLCASDVKKYYEEHPQDALYSLSRPNGSFFMFTAEGEKRFQQLSERGLRALGHEAQKFSAAGVLRDLKKEFVNRILNGPGITDENAHGIFQSALASRTSAHVTLTHHLPCSLVAHRKHKSFSIGPVAFVERTLFLQQHRASIRGHVAETDPLLDQLDRFFSSFSWIATVTVPPCDEAVSKGRANIILQRALDLFKLFVGTPRASLVRRAYDVAAPSRMVSLTSTPDGKYALGYDGGKLTDAVVNDDWYDQIRAFPQWRMAESVISDAGQYDDVLSEAQQRFLDGLSWHSDAISEGDLASRIVKFWTAIERIVTLRKGDVVARRAALLNSDSKAEFAQKLKVAQSLYSKRSEIVHGTANRTEQCVKGSP